MIEKKPKTYNEIIRLKKCYTLANYYSDITENMFNEIYDFLAESEANTIVANQNILSLVDGAGKVVKAFSVSATTKSFDRMEISNRGFSVTPHYDSSSSSWGGSSGNNNNNNNNRNNSSNQQQKHSNNIFYNIYMGNSNKRK